MSIQYFSTPVSPQDIDTIIYHDCCPDGSTSAFCAYSVLGDAAKYIPCSYNNSDPIFENAREKTILFLDFSLKRENFLKLQNLAKKVFILDHHLTAQTELYGIDNVHIDIERCGSSLTWDFFYPEMPQPTFIQYVEDVDLWRWQMKDSYYFSLSYYKFLRTNDFDFKTISGLFSNTGVSRLISEGHNIYLSFVDKVKELCDQIMVVKTKYKNQHVNFGFIECPDKTILNDVAIYALANIELDGLLLSYKYNNTLNKFSLRRLRVNEKVAMHKIAEQYSGGGHAHAASFFSKISPENIFQMIIKKLSLSNNWLT